MGNGTRYSDELVAAYIADRVLGMTAKAAAEKHGVPKGTADTWWLRSKRIEPVISLPVDERKGRYSQEFKDRFCADRELGMNREDAMRKYGISHNTADRWLAEYRKRRRVMAGMGGVPEPKSLKQIRQSTVARKAYEDFAYFRKVCFGATTTPAQAKVAEHLRSVVESRRRDYTCLNVHPGWGKTLMLQHFVLWLIARDRSIRVVWGAASDDMAEVRVDEMRRELARTERSQGNAEDIRSGRAVAPRYCMADLFGRFRPSSRHSVKWTAGIATVAAAREDGKGEGPPHAGPTLFAVGPKSRGQLGKRANFIVWDDVWTRDENDNPERGNKIKAFYDRTATTRLQENGAMVLVMQRLGPGDLSRHVLDKRRPTRDEHGEEVGFEPVYRHVVFPAHHDDLCTGRHPNGMKPWDPDNPVRGQCLTDPLALPPDDFLAARASAAWLVEYQQGEVDAAGAKFREIWLTGGTDEDGQAYRGCLDFDRSLWELPEGVPLGTLASAVSVDVGHEGYWALLASVHSTEPESQMEWILAAEHRKMPAGTERGLFDWDFERKCFVGMLEEWWQNSRAIGVPFTHVIAEINCAQRHLFRDTNNINRWQLARNCRIITHTTTKQKHDPKMGVEYLLAMRMQLGATRWPWRPGATQIAMRDLYNEVVGYEQGYPTDDIVMAWWMRTLNRKRVERPVRSVPDQDRGEKTGLEWASATPRWVQGL